MENSALLTEGIGKGRLGRIVMGKLGMEIDLLEGIREMVKKEKNNYLSEGGDRHRCH